MLSLESFLQCLGLDTFIEVYDGRKAVSVWHWTVEEFLNSEQFKQLKNRLVVKRESRIRATIARNFIPKEHEKDWKISEDSSLMFMFIVLA